MAVSLIGIAYLGILLTQHVSCLEPLDPLGRHDSLVSSLAPVHSGLRAEGLHSSNIQDLVKHLLPSSGIRSVDKAIGQDAASLLPINTHGTNELLPTRINTIHPSIGRHSLVRENRGHISLPIGGSIGHLTSTVRGTSDIGTLDLKNLLGRLKDLRGSNLSRNRARKEHLGLTKTRRNLRTHRRDKNSLIQKYKLYKKRQMLAKKKKLLRKLSKLRRRKALLDRYRTAKRSLTARRLSRSGEPDRRAITRQLIERIRSEPLILFQDPVPQ